MRCLLAVLIALLVVLGACIAAWNWLGGWGVVSALLGGLVLLWSVPRLAPIVVGGRFGELLRKFAEPMRMARITVHHVAAADEADTVAEMLRQFDAWIDEINEEAESSDFHIEVDEFLSHNEIRRNRAHYFVEITVSPPESRPGMRWSPHALRLRPVDPENSSRCDVLDIQEFSPHAGGFRPFLEFAFEEVSGERRIRLHVALDPTVREYQFEYGFAIPLQATLTIPAPDGCEEPIRAFTEGVLGRVIQKRPLKILILNGLPVHDGDLLRISEITELESLALDGTDITDEGLRHLATLRNLVQLSMDKTRISDAGLEYVVQLPRLKRLFARHTQITDAGARRMCGAIPGVEVFF